MGSCGVCGNPHSGNDGDLMEVASYVEHLYYMHDALKNTIALFGIQAGRRALYEFGPYGAIIKRKESGGREPFRFSSEYYDR